MLWKDHVVITSSAFILAVFDRTFPFFGRKMSQVCTKVWVVGGESESGTFVTRTLQQ